jgi:Xaa-Pro dipeptidase
VVADPLDQAYVAHVAELEARYARVLAAEGWDAVVLHSGSLLKRSQFDDQTWPFRAVPHWQHWTPLAEPDCALVVRPGRRPLLFRNSATSFWESPPAPPPGPELGLSFEVVSGDDPAKVRDHLGPGRVAFVGEDAARAASWGIADGAFRPATLVRALDALRVSKTEYEVACLAEANHRARAGHLALRDAFAAGAASELDLHLLYLRSTAQDDAETPYKNIVALGRNAATLHHVAYARGASAREVESLLVDAGATCRGYGSDITRTWTRGSGATAAAFGQLVAGVEALQRGLCAAVTLGMRYEDLHDQAHPLVAQVLCDVGILKGSVDEAVGRGVTRAFFPHGLGHSLGLQTHDVGCGLRPPRADNPFLRNTSDIAVGQVFTIEPGVYFIEALLGPVRTSIVAGLVDWSLVEALAPLGGVRIEDDLHVAGGAPAARNLTREHLP